MDRVRDWAGLFAGPLLLFSWEFTSAGGVTGGYALLILVFGFQALFFLPMFAFLILVFSLRSLVGLLLAANSVPALYIALGCVGRTCPNATWGAISTYLYAASFCALAYWLVVKLWPNRELS